MRTRNPWTLRMLCSTVRAGSYESWERQALYDENPVQRARVVGWLASREPALLWVHLFCRCDVTWLANCTARTVRIHSCAASKSSRWIKILPCPQNEVEFKASCLTCIVIHLCRAHYAEHSSGMDDRQVPTPPFISGSNKQPLARQNTSQLMDALWGLCLPYYETIPWDLHAT